MPARAEHRSTVGPKLLLLALLCCAPACIDDGGGGGGVESGARDGGAAIASGDFVPSPLSDRRRAVDEALRELGFSEVVGRPTDVARVESGRLTFRVSDNSRSPRVLSGLQSLSYLDADERFEAFRAGLNLEHVYSGHRDDRNRFVPRRHPYLVCREREGRSVFMVRLASQSPWSVEHVMRLTPSPPDSIDIDFRCRFLDPSRFGAREYVGFFWANYMRELHDAAIHFRGVSDEDGTEEWIRAESGDGWDVGTYLAADASALEFDTDHNMILNLRSFPTPRFTRPFLFSRSANNMVLILMFDRLQTGIDEIRFSHFPPAVDFQYVIHGVETERRYGFRARMIWRPWTTREECLRAWRSWQPTRDPTDGP